MRTSHEKDWMITDPWKVRYTELGERLDDYKSLKGKVYHGSLDDYKSLKAKVYHGQPLRRKTRITES